MTDSREEEEEEEEEQTNVEKISEKQKFRWSTTTSRKFNRINWSLIINRSNVVQHWLLNS